MSEVEVAGHKLSWGAFIGALGLAFWLGGISYQVMVVNVRQNVHEKLDVHSTANTVHAVGNARITQNEKDIIALRNQIADLSRTVNTSTNEILAEIKKIPKEK